MTPTRQPLGPIGRLGRFAASHRRAVFITWAVVAVGLGVLAPRVEKALSGAGWQTNGSESVKVREQTERDFGGAGAYALQVAVHSESLAAGDPAFKRTVSRVERILAANPAVRAVLTPRTAQLDLRRRPHRDRGRHCCQGPERDGRRRRQPQVRGLRRGRPRNRSRSDRRPRDVVGLQRSQPRRDAEVGADLLAGDVGDPRPRLRLPRRRRAAADADDRRPDLLRRRPLPRHQALADLDLGDELRSDVRPGTGHRLCPVRRHALPRRPLRSAPRSRGGSRSDDGHCRQGRPLLRPDGHGLPGGGAAGSEPGLSLSRAGNHRRGGSSSSRRR